MLYVAIAYCTGKRIGGLTLLCYLTTVAICQIHGLFPVFSPLGWLNLIGVLLWLEGMAGVIASVLDDVICGSFYDLLERRSPVAIVATILLYTAIFTALTVPLLMVLLAIAFILLVIIVGFCDAQIRTQVLGFFRRG